MGIDSTETFVRGETVPELVEALLPGGTVRLPAPAGGELVLGRSRSVSLRLDDPSVSREHARLRFGADEATIEDLGSHNGTWVHGERLAAGVATPVRVGDVIFVGGVELRLLGADAQPPPRRLWPHGYFEGRLEEECGRARRAGAAFAVLRVSAPSAPTGIVEDALADTLRAHDVLGSYASGELEVLLVDAAPAQAEVVAGRLIERLLARQVSARTALACFPRDGRSAHALLAHANDALRGRPGGARGEPFGPEAVLSPAMRHAVAQLEQAAPTMLAVLLLGETGVGKELCAEHVHRRSPRRDATFLRLSCAALPDSLIESELFGHEKGAFTGAGAAKPGLLEAAEGGTVFLDEIGELPATTQVKLLRVLDAKEVHRVGALAPRKIDVRFVAATNRSLEAEVAAGRFREDLYFRLAGMVVRLPPLRERAEELLPLARRFVAEAAAALGRPEPAISEGAAAALARHAWPGNVRELRNVMERAVIVSQGGAIEAEHLPLEKFTAIAPRATLPPPLAGEDPLTTTNPHGRPPLRDEVEALEKQRVLAALEAAGGNQSEAARRLGISRGALLARLRQWGIGRK